MGFFLFPNYTKHGLNAKTRIWYKKKQLARSKIDSNSKLLSSVCESFPSIFACKIFYFACKTHSFHPNRSWVQHGILHQWKVPKPHVLVAKLLMQFIIFTRTISGPYTISWLECRQTNMFDAKTVILYWMSNITKFTVQQFLYVKSMLIH